MWQWLSLVCPVGSGVYSFAALLLLWLLKHWEPSSSTSCLCTRIWLSRLHAERQRLGFFYLAFIETNPAMTNRNCACRRQALRGNKARHGGSRARKRSRNQNVWSAHKTERHWKGALSSLNKWEVGPLIIPLLWTWITHSLKEQPLKIWARVMYHLFMYHQSRKSNQTKETKWQTCQIQWYCSNIWTPFGSCYGLASSPHLCNPEPITPAQKWHDANSIAIYQPFYFHFLLSSHKQHSSVLKY